MDIFKIVVVFLAPCVTSQRNSPPIFSNTWSWVISEDAAVSSQPSPNLSGGKRSVKLSAMDYDGDAITYGVEGEIGTRYFTVDERTGVVKLKIQFDYEVDSTYRARFFATDGIDTTYGDAIISVLDVNDNAPVFDRYPYKTEVSEDTRPGIDILRINATDLDTGLGGRIRYTIEQVVYPKPEALNLRWGHLQLFGPGGVLGSSLPFSLNPVTGALRLVRKLDFEDTDVYQFKVKASDQDPVNPLSSTTQVIVNVKDVQDTNPVFDNLPYDVSIPENTGMGDLVLMLKANDGDTQSPNRIAFSIISGDDEGNFMVTGERLRLATEDLDRDREDANNVYTLTVRASEVGHFSSYTDVTFDVTVTDVNDEIPQWSSERYEITIREDTPLGTKILTMDVQDRDEGPNSEVAIFVEPRYASSFAISPALIQGQSKVSLILNKALDYEMMRRIQFKIYANETMDPTHFSVTNIFIDLVNVNDNVPQFSQPVYTVEVPENTTKDTVIKRMEATDGDDGEFGEILYSIKDTSKKFAIDPKSGDIILYQTLDREEIDQYNILVSASDGGTPSATASVTIHITDINDNTPQFTAQSYATDVTENEAPPTPIALVRAWDNDAPPSNVITYGIKKNRYSHYFKIKKSDDGAGEVFLKAPLNYELLRNGLIRLQIVATDSGTPPENASVSLVVNVRDANDHAPVFTRDSSTNLSITENLGGGVQIGRVRATDRDSGKNKAIRYYVENGRDDFDAVFRLNDVTGDITIKPGSSPDFETMAKYNVTIIAEDEGNPPQSARHNLIISISDINDNAPKFTQDQYITTFDEGTASVVARVEATDADQGVNGEVNYSITGGDSSNFIINAKSGDIIALAPLDYESTSGIYRLIISATDRGEEAQLTSSAEVIIHVTDINDNAPRFQFNGERNEPLVYEVLEGLEGPRIDRFTAIDKDPGPNGFVTYSICEENENGMFSISHSEGDLRVSAGRELDRERVAVHNMTICASDSGTEPLTTMLNISVRVLDINDNPPVFIKIRPEIRVRENFEVGKIVAHIMAHDLDDGENGKVLYEVSSNGDVFRINKWTGSLSVAKPLDRETVPEYNLEITARDNAALTRDIKSTKRLLKIIVTDVNDNSPRFVGKTPYQGAVEENSAVGTEVKIMGDKVLAVDDDAGRNAIVTYSIISDDVSYISGYTGRHRSNFFSIDSNTGIITTQARLDREALVSDRVTLVVRASDHDMQHSDARIIVQINDTNDNAPQFRSKTVRVRVEENAKPGTEVTQIAATDQDIGVNAIVTYVIEKGAFGKFVIDSQTGVVRVASAQRLDREKKSVYNVEVAAVDNGIMTSLSSTCTVTIEIDDVNDSRPKFITPEIDVQVDENTPSGGIIARVRATDPDLNSELRYSIGEFIVFDAHFRQLVPETRSRRSRRNDYDIIKSWFHLNASSGELRVSSESHRIDREICSKVQLAITVRDGMSANEEIAQSLDPAIVTITIQDINDNSPVFVTLSESGDVIELGEEFVVDITEETVIGSVLVILKAEDRDFGSNGQVNYEIKDGSNVQLRDQESGTLVVASRIDRESLPIENDEAWINATVVAHDQGYPQRKSTQIKVAMKVKDINDNYPVFERKRYKASVPENATLNLELVKVVATDEDARHYGDVVYSLRGGGDKFSIHRTRGIVQLTSPLDRESISTYTLVVVATDNEGGLEFNRRESTVPLVVTVLDVNDCPPVFTDPRSPRTYSTQENARVRSFVAVVTAEDPDEGVGAQITYSLKKSRISDYFKIHPSSGHVTIRQSLTTLPRHRAEPKLEVIATDGGGLSSNMTLYLDIVDVNDHAPLFEDVQKELVIQEEQSAGTLVGFMTATDPDFELNGVIRYSICDATTNIADQQFLIDEVTGRITTARRLNREAISSYTIQVCATDLGYPSLQSSASVTVKLLDINDNEPAFPQSSDVTNGGGAYQELHALEDLQVGVVIGRVTRAVDRDTGANAYVYYNLVSDSSQGEGDVFSVMQQSGDIILNKELDRESVEKYSLIIKATNDENYSIPSPIVDDGKKEPVIVKRNAKKNHTEANALATVVDESDELASIKAPSLLPLFDPAKDSSLIKVFIVIDDVNDEPPVFEQRIYVTAVDVEVRKGYEVLEVLATDADAGPNGRVEYSIKKTVLSSRDNRTQKVVYETFKMHSELGIITTAGSLDGYEDGYYVLSVEAADSVKHRASATVYVYLLQSKDKMKFIINSPPSAIREKKKEFVQLLRNITLAHVIVDDIEYHITNVGRRDVQRSDVTIRVFDQRSMKPFKLSELQHKLENNQNQFEKLFGNCATLQDGFISPPSGDSTSLQIIVIIMLAFLLLIILIFSVLYCHMQRRYKRELEAHHANAVASREAENMKFDPNSSVVSNAAMRYSDPGANAVWKEQYRKRLTEQKIVEDDELSSGERVRRREKKKRSTSAPRSSTAKSSSQAHDRKSKTRSKSEENKQLDRGMTRSSTDTCAPRGHKLPVPPAELDAFMKERERRRERKSKPETRTKEDTQSSSGESKSSKRESNRWSLKQDSSSLKRSGRSEDSRSDSTITAVEQPKTKERKRQKKEKRSPTPKGRHSPELSLHSGGGNSEDLIRKHSATLHGSEHSELDKYLDSDTPTNMTSSPSHLTSSMASINLISDL